MDKENLKNENGNSPHHTRVRAPSGQRLILSECVPLKRPISIRIEPARVCNFRCEYCLMSQNNFRQEHLKTAYMEFELFQHVILDAKQSFGKVKTVMLVGMGESLLHPKIAEMVSYIHENQLADIIEIVTNGTCLTPQLSDSLTDAGLSSVRISVNGLCDEDFQKYCGVSVSFSKYVEQIQYLYEHKKNTKIY